MISKVKLSIITVAVILCGLCIILLIYTKPHSHKLSLLLTDATSKESISVEYDLTLRRKLFGGTSVSGNVKFGEETYIFTDKSYKSSKLRIDIEYYSPDDDFPSGCLVLRDYNNDAYSEIEGNSLCFCHMSYNFDGTQSNTVNYRPAIDYYSQHPDEYYSMLRFICDIFAY
ncbi:MAG: hypothetical protein HFE63_06405 [Clostridiales bacterium]|nr:hypothetical protein [Clostridiales bacterium]